MAGKPGRSGTNRGPGRIWSEAIRRACLRTGLDGKTKRLEILAEKLIAAAEAGDIQALKEFGDRVEGKPAQAIVGDDAANPVNVLHKIERVIVGSKD